MNKDKAREQKKEFSTEKEKGNIMFVFDLTCTKINKLLFIYYSIVEMRKKKVAVVCYYWDHRQDRNHVFHRRRHQRASTMVDEDDRKVVGEDRDWVADDWSVVENHRAVDWRKRVVMEDDHIDERVVEVYDLHLNK